jgi:Zn-dependent peptidase ImmA (M78 family)
MAVDLSLKCLAAETKAAELIKYYGINQPEHIQLEDIAFAQGVRILKGPLEGAAASLVRYGDKATIRISDKESDQGRIRFSVAHELGHFILNNGYSIHLVCSNKDTHDWYNQKNQETEANFFASELLLPKTLVEKRCDVEKVNFKPIRSIAEDFSTSLMATAIKFVRLCPEMCAIIYSEDSAIKWFYRSEYWWPFIPKGKLDSRTLAYDFFQGKEISEDPEEIEGDAWIGTSRVESIVEHSIASPAFGFVLSLLWIKP